MSSTERQLESIPEVIKQAFLLLAIVQELFRTVLSLLRGTTSIQDVYLKVLSLPTDASGSSSQEEERSEVPAISPSDSQESESTTSSHASETTEESPSVLNPVRLLCKAIVQRDVEKVSSLLESRPTLAGKGHEGGWHPLHAAVLSGDSRLTKEVLACPGMDVNVLFYYNPFYDGRVRERELGSNVDSLDGATPLHFAVMTGNVEIIHLLAENGANFKMKDANGRKPIDYFKLEENVETIATFKRLYDEWKRKDEFFRDYTNFLELFKLMRKDRYELFERAIKRNHKLASKKACTHVTLLHMAVLLQRRRFVELLISTNKSLVNKRDKRRSGSDLLHNPMNHCCMDVMSSEALRIPSIPPTIPYHHVRKATPLHYACLVKNMDIAKMLLEAGADWTVKDGQGRRPEELIRQAEEGDDEIKSMFARLLQAEEERRKPSAEERPKEHINKKELNDATSRISLSDDESDSDEDEDDDEDEDKNSNPSAKVSMDTLLELEDKIGGKLVGQRGPIHLIANAIRLREGGWIDPDRPLTMLFLGSSGVGKTELAKQLALFLHGKDGLATDKGRNVTSLEKKFCFVRLDMSEYQGRHTVQNLIGAPKSYVGYGDGGALTQPLQANPRAVVLLDEIEKAHPDVLTTFLQVFDDGRITDSKDGTISCKDAIFIMTSNIAGEEIKRAAPRLRQTVTRSEEEGRHESYVHLIQDFTRSIRPQLKQNLKRDEFIGRINQIVVFLPLNKEEIEVVVQRELAMWCKRAEEKHKIMLTWTDEVVRKLAASYDVNYGVRSVANEVQRIALQLVADAHIRGRISENWQAELTLNEVGDIIMSASAKPEDKGEEEYLEAFSDFVWTFAE
ncbi:hypothetical protein ACEPAH_3281 [Sanghuangporus vaninii]